MQRLDCRSRPYRYRVYLEPTFQHWWLALDTVMGPPSPSVRYTGDYQLIAAQPVSRRAELSRALLHSACARWRRSRRRRGARTPACRRGRNPRSRALALRLRRDAGSDIAFVHAVLEFLRTGGFTYTLTPPPLGPNPVDDFLFQHPQRVLRPLCLGLRRPDARRRRSRAGGRPAISGGQWNPYDGTLIVRQSDAHAWAEVWLQGRGWTRVDPTAVVAPEQALSRHPRPAAECRSPPPSAWCMPGRGSAPPLERWEALNGWWSDRVVAFNYRRSSPARSARASARPSCAMRAGRSR